jgi:hypothetical protein
VGGVTVTVVTTGAGGGGEVTATLAVPDFPAVVAVIVAEPAATPVTTPFELTVAAAGLLVDQAMLWPVITFPWASFTVAESVTEPPTVIDDDGGETTTVVTTGAGGGGGGGGGGGSWLGAVTVTSEVPLFPAIVAVIVAEPAASPATTPLELTTAVEALLVDHEMTSPGMTFPSASFTVAASVVVVPATTDAVAGATLTVVTTGVGVGVGSVVVPEPEHTESAGTRTNNHD